MSRTGGVGWQGGSDIVLSALTENGGWENQNQEETNHCHSQFWKVNKNYRDNH